VERFPVDGLDSKAGRVLSGTQRLYLFGACCNRNIGMTVLNGKTAGQTHHHRDCEEAEQHLSGRLLSYERDSHSGSFLLDTY
jgi:hypothetical protein